MRLSALVSKLGGRLQPGAPDVSVLDVHIDSRDVTARSLFATLPSVGAAPEDLHLEFLPDALSRGASAVLTPTALALDGQPPPASGACPQWVHRDARRVAGEAAALIHGRYTERLRLCAITGTNGKTTTAHLVGQLLDHAGLECGVLGTAGHRLAGGVRLTASHTTPDGPQLQRLLRQHAQAGGVCAALEVSSHALTQERTAGLQFQVAVFTNLTREHLDYHGDLASYAAAKARLFASLAPGAFAVVNLDDPAHASMQAAALAAGAEVITYSVRRPADLRASRLEAESQGTRFSLEGMGISTRRLRLPLRGRYNVENALAAAAAARLMGASPSDLLEGLAVTSPAPGRLEPVSSPGRGFLLYVDYAHSPDALERVLGTLREGLRGGRLIVVFGCGGDRDRGKRSEMGGAAARLADISVVTSDNPRSESPARIAAEVLTGMRAAARPPIVELDRRRAIECAIAEARPGDVVLVAGKGHETEQVIGAERIAFDDRAVAMEILG